MLGSVVKRSEFLYTCRRVHNLHHQGVISNPPQTTCQSSNIVSFFIATPANNHNT